MNQMTFNIEGFTKPATRAECAELLREMGRIIDDLQNEWDAIGETLAARAQVVAD